MGRILGSFFYQANRRTWNAKFDHTRMVGWKIEPAPGVDDWRVETTCPEEKKLDGGLMYHCVINVDGTISAMDDSRLHQGLSLGASSLEGKANPCRGHDWHYNVTRGNTLHVPD